MTDETRTQPTGSGKLIWRKPLERDVVDRAQFATAEAVPADLAPTTFAKLAMMFPDPRDARIAELEVQVDLITKIGVGYWNGEEVALARIAELEAALKLIDALTQDHRPLSRVGISRIIDAVLMPSPERDMAITQEELDA